MALQIRHDLAQRAAEVSRHLSAYQPSKYNMAAPLCLPKEREQQSACRMLWRTGCTVGCFLPATRFLELELDIEGMHVMCSPMVRLQGPIPTTSSCRRSTVLVCSGARGQLRPPQGSAGGTEALPQAQQQQQHGRQQQLLQGQHQQQGQQQQLLQGQCQQEVVVVSEPGKL